MVKSLYKAKDSTKALYTIKFENAKYVTQITYLNMFIYVVGYKDGHYAVKKFSGKLTKHDLSCDSLVSSWIRENGKHCALRRISKKEFQSIDASNIFCGAWLG